MSDLPADPAPSDASTTTNNNATTDAPNDTESDGIPDEPSAQKSENNSPENMSFEQGIWVYTDPSSGAKYKHDVQSGEWVPLGEENDKNTQLVNGIWVHRDPQTGIASFFDSDKNSWVKCGAEESEEKEEEKEVEDPAAEDADETEKFDEFEFQLKEQQKEEKRKEKERLKSSVYRDPRDGTPYEWDKARGGWFPQLDDDFIARYQANYGSYKEDEATSSKEEKPKPKEDSEADEEKKKIAAMGAEERRIYLRNKKKEKRKLEIMKEKERKWFELDETHNTTVYVNGMPDDITEAEFQEIMSKCGVVALDPANRKMKLKLYKDSEGKNKGDGRCCYVKRESVELAEQILDGYDIRGFKLSVQLAQFEQKGDWDPSKKRKRISAKMKKKFREQQEKLFDWRPEKMAGERPKSDNTVIIKNLFKIEEFFENAARLLECQNNVRAMCAKYGQVRKVVVYDNNPEGVASVTFATPEQAGDCVTMTNYRLHGGKQLRSEIWDGKTTYKIKETKEEEEERLKNWAQFLEKGE